eukprot:12367710-Prorocentrum_lima.AAC.1
MALTGFSPPPPLAPSHSFSAMDYLGQIAAAMEEWEAATPTPPQHRQALEWEAEDMQVPHPYDSSFGHVAPRSARFCMLVLQGPPGSQRCV